MTYTMGCEDWATNEYLLIAINSEHLRLSSLSGISSMWLFREHEDEYFRSLKGEYPDFKYIDNWYKIRIKEMKNEAQS